MKDFSPTLKGKRIELRIMEPTFDNAKIMFEAIDESRSHLIPWLKWAAKENTPTPEVCFFMLDENKTNFEEKKTCKYGIFEKDVFLGQVMLHTLSDRHNSAKLGYWLRKSALGKGYMCDAIKLLEKEAFSGTDGLNRLVIDPEERNKKSVAVAKRLNYTLDGTTRKSFLNTFDNIYVNECIFSKLKSEWEKGAKAVSDA